jgi:ubiquinone/menaquinone biosynthesis C-methylase UbiE
MELNTAIQLIQHNDIKNTGASQQWADLGCGSGLFTQALATLLPGGSTVYAIDKKDDFDYNFQNPKATASITFMRQDIESMPFHAPLLDGVLMANVLHYIKDKNAFVQKLKGQLKPGAFILIVEYNTNIAVPIWVPYPVSFSKLKLLFSENGISEIDQIGRVPSRFRRADLYSVIVKT